MARTNMTDTRVKPVNAELLTLRVLRRERISPNFARVTLGHGDIDMFTYMGYDQWFRLFIPVTDGSLSRAPKKLDTMSYLRYLAVSKTERPVLRNYTVRAYRPTGPDGAELDVDFVLHTSPNGTTGPAMTWAQQCSAGDPVGIFDEGTMFPRRPPAPNVRLVADESGLPAVAGILQSLPADTTGSAIIEVPSDGDRQQLDGPPGVEVRWLARNGDSVTPGSAALEEALAAPTGDDFYGWVVGESALPTALRRHWIKTGTPKANISFCGYWKHRGGR